eukprot:3309651-Amphidinium_carterae.1
MQIGLARLACASCSCKPASDNSSPRFPGIELQRRRDVVLTLLCLEMFSKSGDLPAVHSIQSSGASDAAALLQSSVCLKNKRKFI